MGEDDDRVIQPVDVGQGQQMSLKRKRKQFRLQGHPRFGVASLVSR